MLMIKHNIIEAFVNTIAEIVQHLLLFLYTRSVCARIRLCPALGLIPIVILKIHNCRWCRHFGPLSDEVNRKHDCLIAIAFVLAQQIN